MVSSLIAYLLGSLLAFDCNCSTALRLTLAISAHFFILERSLPRGLGIVAPFSDSAIAPSIISATFFGNCEDAFHRSFLGSGVGEAAFVILGTGVAVATGVALGEANGSVKLPEGERPVPGFAEQAAKPKRNTISGMNLNLMAGRLSLAAQLLFRLKVP